MKQRLSTRSIFTTTSALSMSIVSLLFMLPGTGTVSGRLFGTFTVVAAMWAATQLTRWMTPVRVTVPAASVR